MGTRSVTTVFEGTTPILAIYRQMDGYPSGMGKDLADFMVSMTIVNGIGLGAKAGTHANGAGCFAAQLLAKLKDEAGIGGVYVLAPTKRRDKRSGEEYTYDIQVFDEGKHPVLVNAYCGSRIIFTGTRLEFEEFCSTRDND